MTGTFFCKHRRAITLLIAAGSAAWLSNAAALPFVLNDDIRGVWNNRIAIGTAIRAKNPDKQLVGANNAPEYPGAKGAASVNDDGLDWIRGLPNTSCARR